jgi:hypothetical protein
VKRALIAGQEIKGPHHARGFRILWSLPGKFLMTRSRPKHNKNQLKIIEQTCEDSKKMPVAGR